MIPGMPRPTAPGSDGAGSDRTPPDIGVPSWIAVEDVGGAIRAGIGAPIGTAAVPPSCARPAPAPIVATQSRPSIR